MNDKKPMIRHCKNCKCSFYDYCLLRFTYISMPRLKALFCKYYKQKEVQDESN